MGAKTRYVAIAVVAVLIIVASLILSRKYFPRLLQPFPKPPPPAAQNRPARNPFIDLTPVVYHPSARQEIPVTGGEALNPRVSPDGARIVFIIRGGGKSTLALAELPAGRVSPLPVGPVDAADPSWSADGVKVVFAGTRAGTSEIYIYDLKEKKLNQVTRDPKRRKSWPRFSPFRFGDHYRIAYTSEEQGRRDIWWVRESGEYDQPVTVAPERAKEFREAEYWKKESDAGVPPPVTTGGECPEWSPSGNIIIYRTGPKRYAALAYNYYDWWRTAKIRMPASAGFLSWAPNQCSFLEYDPPRKGAALIARPEMRRKAVLAGIPLTSAPAFFPDGRGFASSTSRGENSFIVIEPHDDPLGDVANLWMFPYSPAELEKLARNRLIFLETDYDQIYTLYDSESYRTGTEDEFSNHARPYLVTSDAVLETFYAAFAALYANTERTVLAKALTEFCAAGAGLAREKKAAQDVATLFQVGLALLRPETARGAPSQVREELALIEEAAQRRTSLFGRKVDYRDFFIRGKYERDTDLRGYFRALKWFQAFTFDLDKEDERRQAAALLAVAGSPRLRPPLETIYSVHGRILGESRYLNPLNLKEAGAALPARKGGLPWVAPVNRFRLLPPIFTLDAFIFDELITHTDRPDTVGTGENPRMLPRGLDIMAALGSAEARKILIEELKEGRFANYERHLDRVAGLISRYSPSVWDANLYQSWLDLMGSLTREPAGSPDFTKSAAWKRKELNTALGSWVNLRYETIAMVEQVGAEAGEAGYEVLEVGRPRGYVEPNPDFFRALEKAFERIAREFAASIGDPDLRKEIANRLAEHRGHLKALERIARKELAREPLTDAEYEEIINIGGTVEHFIQVISSASGDETRPLANPEPIRKIVDVQKDELHNVRLYEALGHAAEVDAAVPYYGRRQLARGSVYSYFEFTSPESLDSTGWRAMKQRPPAWIRDYYGERRVKPLATLGTGK